MTTTANTVQSQAAQPGLFDLPPGHMAFLAMYEDNEPDAWDALLRERAAYLADDAARDDARPFPPIVARPEVLATARDRAIVEQVASRLRVEYAADLSDAELDRILAPCVLTSLPALARRYRDAGALTLAPEA